MGVIQRAIDGAIAAISPQKALERAEARQQLARTRVINTGYSHYGASSYKKEMAGWIYNGGSSREDIEDNLDVLRQRSRDLYMGVPLATGAIKTMRTNIVGRGLKLKPTIDREVLGIDADAAHALERRIEKEWELWADTPDCDAARIDNFPSPGTGFPSAPAAGCWLPAAFCVTSLNFSSSCFSCSTFA